MVQKGNSVSFLNGQANLFANNHDEKDTNLDSFDFNESLRAGGNLMKRNPPDYINNDFTSEELFKGMLNKVLSNLN